jgi:hypothetical protein
MPRPIKYTGKRIEQYEFIRIFLEDDATERNRAIALLNKQQKAVNKREATIAKKKREAEEERRFLEQQALIAAKLALEEEKKNRKRVTVIADIKHRPITDTDAFATDIQDRLIKALDKLVGKKHAYLQVSQSGKIVISKLIDIEGNDGEAIYWNNIYYNLIQQGGSTNSINVFSHNFTNGFKPLRKSQTVRLVIIESDTVPAERIQQKYRDGDNHCVLEPLYRLYKKIADNSIAESSIKRYTQIANKMKSLEAVYPTGVPEDKMEDIAKMAHRCIVIYDIVGNIITSYNKRSSASIYFTNTRVNHIDEGFITLDKQYENVSQAEMERLVRKHDKNNVFYLKRERDGMTQSIRSCKGAYAVYNEDHEIFKNFSSSMGIKNFGIDAIKYRELNQLTKEARIINSAPTPLCDYPNELDDVKHIDVEKAYTQHKHAKYYKGFLGHIQMWAKLPANTTTDFLNNHIGIFQFVVLNDASQLLQKLGIKKGNVYSLPSPEIEYCINEHGLSVQLLAGAWGSTFDIEYTPEMLDKRRYCTWAGKLGMDSDIDTYSFNGNREWAAHLKAELGDNNVMYFSQQNLIVVKVPKKSYKTTHHILAFITSYTRINMLDIMSKIDGELVKVVLDGVYYRGEVQDVTIPHKTDKDLVKHLGFRDAWYYPSTVSTDSFPVYTAPLDGSCVLSGAGGTGKSYSVLTNKSIVNPLYVVPSHVLGRKCREKYGCNYTTIHKLIGMECQPFRDTNYVPGVIFVDELTMVESSWIEKALEMYPNAVFYIAGDIDERQWFQCRNGHPGQFSKIWIPKNWRFVNYTNDMRSKDEELKKFKSDVRDAMRSIFTDGGQTDSTRVSAYVKKNYKTVTFDEAASMFQNGDMWIAGTHKTNDELLKRGIASGYINRNKEIVAEDEAGAVKRGSFTTHSFQGLTIESQRVFMSLDFFEYAMLYTSISRVCNYNQIVLVR